MGYRVNNAKAGNIYSTLIYGKGAFILHMIRSMMWDNKAGDALFRDTMRDFVTTYKDRPASTEDFKAIVEKHMIPDMDLDGNHRMDWFFNEWVYGTDIPTYQFSYEMGKNEQGNVIQISLTQSNVSPTFKMPVPIFAELQNGSIIRLGTAAMVGNNGMQQKIPLGNNPLPKRLIANYNYDVLSTM